VNESPAAQRTSSAFAKLFTANVSSSFGDGIARTAIPLLAISVTRDPLLISGVAALQMLPWLLFALPAGMIVDRIDRRWALAIANGVRTVLASVLLILAVTGSLTIWLLFVIVFIFGSCETIYDGAIRAIVPSVVARAELPKANGRIEAGEQVVQNFLAGPFTSLLLAVAVAIPLGVNVAMYALAGGLAFALPAAASGRQFSAATPDRQSLRQQLSEGLRFILGSPMLRWLWLLSTVTALFFSLATSSFVLFLVDRVGLPEQFFGVFMLGGAAGGLLAALATSRLASAWGAGLTMAIMTVIEAIGLLAVGLLPLLSVAILGFVVTSSAVTVWNILVVSLRQSAIPGRLLGRVHGTWRTLLWGIMPLGSVLGGLVASIDLALPFIIGGGGALLVSLVSFRFLRGLPNPEQIDNGDSPIESAGIQPPPLE
jgi:Na+/melibiose symporter-like transporter